jgi:hypothetical protein
MVGRSAEAEESALDVQLVSMSKFEHASYSRFLAACEDRLVRERQHLERLRKRFARAVVQLRKIHDQPRTQAS